MCTKVQSVPVTITIYVPVYVRSDVDTVSVDAATPPEGIVTAEESRLAVGDVTEEMPPSTLAVRVTAPAKLSMEPRLIVGVPEEPAAMLILDGMAEMVKSGVVVWWWREAGIGWISQPEKL